MARKFSCGFSQPRHKTCSLPRNCPMYPDLDQGVVGQPGGVEFVGAIVCIDPAQNQPEMTKGN
jgi:hypothetical protein